MRKTAHSSAIRHPNSRSASTTTFSYKGFDLNIFLNGSVGNKAINLIRRTFTDPMRNSNLLKEATDIALIAMYDPEVGDDTFQCLRGQRRCSQSTTHHYQ